MAKDNNDKNKTVRRVFYLVVFGSIAVALAAGLDYYSLPLAERPLAPAHENLKPGGFVGHGYGVVGSLMVLTLLLYSLRKRRVVGFRWGKTSTWLKVHIFLGLVGPMLITLHTSFKLSGLISIGFYAMLCVVLSGIFGRYIYIQIPRTTKGAELKVAQIEELEAELDEKLTTLYKVSPDKLRRILQIVGTSPEVSEGKFRAIWSTIRKDSARMLFRPFIRRRVVRMLPELRPSTARKAFKLAERKALLHRRMVYLNSFQSIFHYWHVLHKPFAYIMILIMFIHVGVAILFGYTWIF